MSRSSNDICDTVLVLLAYVFRNISKKILGKGESKLAVTLAPKLVCLFHDELIEGERIGCIGENDCIKI